MHYRIRHYKLRTRRRARRLEQRYRNHPRLIPMLAGLSLVFIFIILAITLRDSASNITRATSANIVILHADDQTKVLPTDEATVGAFLEKAGVKVKEGDVVEPGLDEEVVGDDFRINVYRAGPVVIYDEDKRVYSHSAATTARSIAAQAGVDTFAEDIVVAQPSEDFLRDGIGHKVTIKRSTPVNLVIYGTPLATRTQAKTVRELLAEKNIVLGEGETVQPGLDEPLPVTDPVFINQKGVSIETVLEEVPMPVEYIEDPSLTYGNTAIRQKGQPGQKMITYQVNSETGAKVRFKEIVIAQPVTQIVARGTGGRFENYNADGIPSRVFCGSPKQQTWKNINVQNAALGRAMAAAKGWSGGQFTALIELFACESSWNERAGNPYSGAYGIPQAYPASKMGDPAQCGGAGYETDPQIQIAWGLCYIQRRFGTPSAALDYHYRNNFY